MPAPDTQHVVNVIREAAEFTRRMGFEAEAAALDAFSARFQQERPTLKTLRGPVQEAKDNASRKIRGVLWDALLQVRPEKRDDNAEFDRIWRAFWDIIYPQERKPTEVKGLVPGSDEGTWVLGDVSAAHGIAEQALEVVKRFSEAVIRQDIEAAYGLCANELRSWMGVKRFISELEKANRQFTGKPLKYWPEQITWIYADEAARKESNKEGEWPKDTPKPNKRALVRGWWTDRKSEVGESGRSVFFWVTEEPEGYRIAKFHQDHP